MNCFFVVCVFFCVFVVIFFVVFMLVYVEESQFCVDVVMVDLNEIIVMVGSQWGFVVSMVEVGVFCGMVLCDIFVIVNVVMCEVLDVQ